MLPGNGCACLPARLPAAAADLFPASFVFYDRQMPPGTVQTSAAAVQQLLASAHLLQAAAWQLQGNAALEASHALTVLNAYGAGVCQAGPYGPK